MTKIFIFGDEHTHRNYVNLFKSLNFRTVTSFNLADGENADMLVLTGGGDVVPKLYNGNIAFSNHDFTRDIKELSALEYFTFKRKPVLAVCRGMQIANVFFGGTLCNVQNGNLHKNPEGDTYHLITASTESLLYKTYGKTFYVNSSHRQEIMKTGKDVIPEAFSLDGVVECARHKTLPVFMTQFHPERPLLKDGDDGRNFVKNVCNYLKF